MININHIKKASIQLITFFSGFYLTTTNILCRLQKSKKPIKQNNNSSFALDNQSKIIIISLIFAISLLGYGAYSQGYFEALTPQPEISLVKTSIYGSSRCTILFYLVNSGDTDGFATVELRDKSSNRLIIENRYFIEANTESERNGWYRDEIPINSCNKDNYVLNISEIEKG